MKTDTPVAIAKACDYPTLTPIDRPILTPPNGHKKVLLHSCCAPCSGEVMEAMIASGIEFTIYFYNPNIHPKKNTKFAKTKTSLLPKSMVYHSLMLIMTWTTGLPVPKAWSKTLSEADDVPCVLTCDLSALLYTPTSMVFL